MKEPRLLPTTFPNILVSANKGIGVAMASDICGFNLNEVCTATMHYLQDPDCDLLEYMPMPDFSTGGEIIYRREEMEKIVETGLGSFQIRSRWRWIPEERIIEVYEIPYTTKTDVIIERIVKLSKEGKVKEIADIRDETDLSGLRIAIDLKRGVDPDKLMAKLYRSTTLQDSFSCNFNVLVDGYPRVMGVRQILHEWVKWRIESTRRRINFDLGKKSERLLRADGHDVVATNRGYVLQEAPSSPAVPTRLVKVRHSVEQAGDELTSIVDAGGAVLNVIVNHRVYGKITADLDIRNRRDVERYLHDIDEALSVPGVARPHHYKRSSGGVQVSRRLIGQDDGRVIDEGARDCDALHLAARELGYAVVPVVDGQRDSLQRVNGAHLALATGHIGVGQRQHHVFDNRQARQQVEALKDKANTQGADFGELVIIELGHVEPLQVIVARRRFVQAAQDVHER